MYKAIWLIMPGFGVSRAPVLLESSPYCKKKNKYNNAGWYASNESLCIVAGEWSLPGVW